MNLLELLTFKKGKDMAQKKVTGASLIEAKAKKLKLKDPDSTKAVLNIIDTKAIGRQKAPKGWTPEEWAKVMKQGQKDKLITAGALIASQIDEILAEEKDEDDEEE